MIVRTSSEAILRLLVLLLFASSSAECFSFEDHDDDDEASGNLFFGIFEKCFFHRDSCGFWQLGTILHVGPPESPDCRQICSYLPLFKLLFLYSCGSCQIMPTENPTAIPSAQPSSAPSRPTTTSYTIFLDMEQNVPIADQRFFVDAAARWEQVVVGDLPNIASQRILDSFPVTGLPAEGCTYPEIIDDLYVCSVYRAIDGPGRVLATALPTFWRLPSNLPITGEIEFDTVDINSLKARGNFFDVVLHEMVRWLDLNTYYIMSGDPLFFPILWSRRC